MVNNKARARRDQTAKRREYLAAKRVPKEYWHGGAPGRQPGDYLLSLEAATSVPGSMTAHTRQRGYAIGLTRSNRVYFSSDRNVARAFAAMYQTADRESGIVYERGTLYRVEPEGGIEEDEDFAGKNVSWCAPKARIVEVEETQVYMEYPAATRYIGPLMTWDDGTPIYSRTGAYLPSPTLRAAGYSAASFAGRYQPWTPIDLVEADMKNQAARDRPDAAETTGVLAQAASSARVFRRHIASSTHLTASGVVFNDSPDNVGVAAINALFAAEKLRGNLRKHHDDHRGVVVAQHPTEGVIGGAMVEAAAFGDRKVIWISSIAVLEKWRGQGLGTVLVNMAGSLAGEGREFVAGHCEPNVAAFFTRTGFTVLKDGIGLLLPFKMETPHVLGGLKDEVWFYRQSTF